MLWICSVIMEHRALHSFNDLIEIKFCQNKKWCCLIDSGHRLADLSGPVSSAVLLFSQEIGNPTGNSWDFPLKNVPAVYMSTDRQIVCHFTASFLGPKLFDLHPDSNYPHTLLVSSSQSTDMLLCLSLSPFCSISFICCVT